MFKLDFNAKEARKLTRTASVYVNTFTMWHNIRTAASLGETTVYVKFRTVNQRNTAKLLLEARGYAVTCRDKTMRIEW